MGKDIKVLTLSIFTLILSLLNLKNGIFFYVTDNTEHNAPSFEVKEKIGQIKPEILQREIAIPAQNSIASVSTKENETKKKLDFTDTKTSKINCNKSMPEASNINYCHYMGSEAFFVYGHNTENIFKNLINLGQNDEITLKLDGKIRTYRVINNFTLDLTVLSGKDASFLRTQLYTSTYGGKFDLTIQTCDQNKEKRRFIQAIELK